MWILLACAFAFLSIASLILPWINRSRILKLRQELDELRSQVNKEVADRKFTAAQKNESVVTEPKDLASPLIVTSNYPPVNVTASITSPTVKTSSANEAPIKQAESSTFSQEQTNHSQKQISFEQQFGARLPVWIGGIALALAGFYMVKYSIETGLLSPSVRVILGTLFGIGMLFAANWMRTKPDFANGTRISQALSGAGIADLYVCIFAAANLYHLIPPFVGFAGMAAVTATAVILSLRHGMPIALLGLVGGFLTPAMVGSNSPNAPLLFIYLYFVLTGLMVVIRRQHWWIMAIPSVLGAFLWVCIWVFGGHFSPTDSIYLGLFLLAISATMIKFSHDATLDGSIDKTDIAIEGLTLSSAITYITLGGGIVLMGTIAAQAGFGMLEWCLFLMISLGGIALAFFNQRLYGLVPWIAMAVNVVMLVSWRGADPQSFAMVVCLFGALFIISGYLLQSRSEKPLMWAGLTAAGSLIYYLIAYYELHEKVSISFIPLFWGAIALEFAGIGSLVLKKLYKDIPHSYPQKQHVLAIYAAVSTAFISIGLTIELPREFLSVAFALQLLAITWINSKMSINALRYIAGILACVFGFLLVPQIMLLIQLTAYSLVEARLRLQDTVPLVDWPFFQLGIPALCFAGASLLLRKKNDDGLVRALEVSAIALVGVMGYYLMRHAFHIDENILFVKAGFIERGTITNAIFIYGLACLAIGRRYAREAISHSGLVLCLVAIFRIGYFDFLAYNPLWSHQSVGELPIFNALLLTYGLAILWTFLFVRELPAIGKSAWEKYGYGAMLLLGFTLITLNVRQFFHGTYLNSHNASNAEIYAYSVAWLLIGIALLFFGTLRDNKMIRVASLAVMILTVGKVFLYDAAELDGLLRVFSFFGLGLSLLGLSWFYTRFVFARQTT